MSLLANRKKLRIALLIGYCSMQMNMGGAKDRPMLQEVWDNTAADLRGRSPVHKYYSKTTFFGVMGRKIFG